jgi:hypothetical protein
MIIEQHAVYSIEWDHDNESLGRVDLMRGLDPRQHAFSPETYSKFKYGSTTACRHYASEIYRALQCLFSADLERHATDLVMTSSAYKSMPAASTALLENVMDIANAERRLRNLTSLGGVKIHRGTVLKTDYALMTEESRALAMESTRLHIDTSRLRGKHLVVLDDCVITGAHARNISRHLRDSGVAKLSYLFIVSVRSSSSSSSPSCRSTTSAENYLNHRHVSSMDRWLEMMNAPDAGPVSARALKYYLTSGESRDVKCGVLAQLRHEAAQQIYRGAIADGMASSYEDQMRAIERQLVANDGMRTIERQLVANNEMRTIEDPVGRDGGVDCVARKVSDADDAEGSEEDARDESSSPRRHLPPPSPPPTARPILQRSKSSTICRPMRDLRSSLRRHESETFRASKRPILLVDAGHEYI